MKKLEKTLLLGLVLALLINPLSAFAGDSARVRQDTLRLHILANSDTPEDQALKLKVRDYILAQTGDMFMAARGKSDAKALAEQNLPYIESLARAELARQGSSYTVKAQVVNMFFDTRLYGENTIMPAGRYDAVRIMIGDGAGKNWWCVMFPPLCLPAATGETSPVATPEAQEIAALDARPQYKVGFATVELVEKVGHLIDNARKPDTASSSSSSSSSATAQS